MTTIKSILLIGFIFTQFSQIQMAQADIFRYITGGTALDRKLLVAASKGDSEGVKSLLEKGASAKAKDKDGRTALHWIAGWGRSDTTKLLLKEDADVHAKNDNGETPLHDAARNGRPIIVEILVDAGADMEAKDNGGWTPLYNAAGEGHFYSATSDGHSIVVEFFIAKGVDINIKNEKGWTALHNAAFYNRPEVVKILAATKGADIEARDNYGWTALHWAAYYPRYEVFKILLDAGANKDAKNNNGETPTDIAQRMNYPETSNLLKQFENQSLPATKKQKTTQQQKNCTNLFSN